METQGARQFGGHLILSGMLCLFSAMLLAILGMFLTLRLNNPAGTSFLALAKFFAALWLPLIVIGAFVRMTNPDTESAERSSTNENDEAPNA